MEVFPFLHLRDIVPSFPDFQSLMNSVKVAKMKPASVFSFVVVVIFLNSVTESAAATGTDAAARTYNLKNLKF